jgi:hypothetical protein
VKQVLFAFFLFLAVPPLFAQTAPEESFVYIMDIEGGTTEERSFFTTNLRVEIPAAGYTLTNDILKADYALDCYIADEEEEGGRLLICALLDAEEGTEIVSTALLYGSLEEADETLPYILRSIFLNAAHKPPPEIVEVEKEKPVYIEVIKETGTDPSKQTGRSAGRKGSSGQTGPGEDGWKYRWVFLNLRAGPSLRYYLGGNSATPSASIITFDAGFEAEAHFLNFLALQLGLGFALDQAEYRQSPLNPWSVVYATSVIVAPAMAKFIFNPSPLTTLGPYFGAYATFPLLGAAKPAPWGLLGGLDLSVKTGLGVLLFDIRCAMDMGLTGIMESSVVYYRTFLTLSAGYKFGFIER